MNNAPVAKLPFWETIKRSFMFVLLNIPTVWKVSALWLVLMVYEAGTGFPSICGLNPEGCRNSLAENVSLFLIAIAGVSITTSFCRFVILKEEISKFRISFGLRELKFLGYSILLFLVFALPVIILMSGYILFCNYFEMPREIRYLSIVIPFAVVIFLCGLSLILPAIAVDNGEIRFSKAFQMTKGNRHRIFWSQVALMIPVFFFIMLVSFIFGVIGVNNVVMKFLFATALMLLSFFNSCLRASYFSHLYQFFMFHEKQKDK